MIERISEYRCDCSINWIMLNTVNVEDSGSCPGSHPYIHLNNIFCSDVAQLVEQALHKGEVTGSNPVIATKCI